MEDSSSSEFSTSENEFDERDDDSSQDSKMFDPVKDESIIEFLSNKPTKPLYGWHATREMVLRQYGNFLKQNHMHMH